MSSDIHLNVECRGADGDWHAVERPIRRCWLCEGRRRGGRRDKCPRCAGTGRRRDDFYSERCDTLFGVLAGLRDYTVECIDVSRGLPDDLSVEFSDFEDRRLERWGELMALEEKHEEGDLDAVAFEAAYDDYSRMFDEPLAFDIGEFGFSWLTVGELLEYDWRRPHNDHLGASTVAEICAEFLRVLHLELLPLGPPGDVRIVFGFS